MATQDVVPDEMLPIKDSHLAAWRLDLRRYGGWSALWREQSLWAVLWYRLGSAVHHSRLPPLLRRALMVPWWVGFRFVELALGVSLPAGARIGGGLRIWHFGGIFVHSEARIGRNCTMRQGVTIGMRHESGGLPVLGDDVEIGACAQILGDIRIGDRVKIGAMSLVLRDVPDDHSAMGIPARVVSSGISKPSAVFSQEPDA